MNRLIKNPFLHCLIIGLLVALFSQWVPQQTTIFLHHSEITALQKELSESMNGRAVEFNRSAQLLAEQEILFLEAKKSGFDKVDSVILRLANIAEFLQLADTDQSLDEKYQAALAMNLDETDIIVRRQMISIYQATLRNSMPAKIPSDQAINDWYQRHHSSFIEAPKYAFSHVYLSSDKAHSDSSISINLLEKLRSELSSHADYEANISAAIALGDVFYGGHHFNLQSQHSITKRFGQSFAKQLENLSLRQWSESISSAFGQHFVWLHEKHNARLKPLAEVKQQIINTLNREAKQNHYNETLNKLKKNYRLIIEDEQGNQSSLTLIGLKSSDD